jgi:hypothetical protein
MIRSEKKRRESGEVVSFDYVAEGRVEKVVREAVTPSSQSKKQGSAMNFNLKSPRLSLQ